MNERQAELNWIYEAIGNGELECTDAVMTHINELEGGLSILNPIDNPLTFTEWCNQSAVECHYNSFHGEYGNLAGLLSDYKQYHYDEYLERFKIYGKYTTLIYS